MAGGRWQRRLDPWQRRLAGGCYLTRDAAGLVSEAGFSLERNERRYVKRPKPWRWLTLGVGVHPSE